MPIPKARAGNQLKYHFTGDTVLARPTSWEVSLHTGNPVLGNEVDVADIPSYERQTATFEYDEVADGGSEDRARVRNDVLVEWAPVDAGSPQVNITHVAVWDASAGTLLGYGPLTPSVTTTDGTIVSLASGVIDIRD